MDMVGEKASNSIKEAFIKAFQHYFDFKGRTSRYDYWGFFLVNLAVYFVLGILAAFTPLFGLLASIYRLVSFIPGLSITIRRLHDVGKSTWWFFRGIILGLILLGAVFLLIRSGTAINSPFAFIPIVVGAAVYFILWSLFIFYFLIKRGIAAENEWGEPVFENARQESTGKKIIIFYVCFMTITLVVPLVLGGVAGYSRTMNNYKGNKLEDQIFMIKSNVMTLYSSQANYHGLDNVSAVQTGIVPADMLVEGDASQIVTPYGGHLYVNAVDDGEAFIISIDSVSEDVCLQLKDSVQATVTDISIDGMSVGDCQACGHSKCVMTWKW